MFINEEILNDKSVALLTIEGEFWENEWSLHEKVKRLIERKITNIVVDFSNSKRINSQGIGVLVSCLTSLRDAGGNLKIAGAGKGILDLLSLLNLYTIVESFETAEEAVASFQTV